MGWYSAVAESSVPALGSGSSRMSVTTGVPMCSDVRTNVLVPTPVLLNASPGRTLNVKLDALRPTLTNANARLRVRVNVLVPTPEDVIESALRRVSVNELVPTPALVNVRARFAAKLN